MFSLITPALSKNYYKDVTVTVHVHNLQYLMIYRVLNAIGPSFMQKNIYSSG